MSNTKILSRYTEMEFILYYVFEISVLCKELEMRDLNRTAMKMLTIADVN